MTDDSTIMTTRVGSGINVDMTVQYLGSIENRKGVSEDVDIVNLNNTASIGRYKSDILSREGVRSLFYSCVQLCMLSHSSESFNSWMSLKWKAWMCFKSIYKWFSKAQQDLTSILE